MPLSHFHIAIFFKFIAANLSLTHFVTCVKPLYCVYRIPYFSFASAKMRSIVSFRLLYNSLYSGIYLASSAFSTHPLQICLNTLFSKLLPAVHFSLTGQLRHSALLFLYSLYPSLFVVLYSNIPPSGHITQSYYSSYTYSWGLKYPFFPIGLLYAVDSTFPFSNILLQIAGVL